MMVRLVLLILLFLMPVQARAQSAFDDPDAVSASGRGGDLTFVQGEIDGGDISIGATAQVVALFRNDSGRLIETGAIQTYPSSTVSASISLNQCNKEPLPPGGVCAVALSVKGLQAGAWRVEMLMRHTGRSRLVTSTMQGHVIASDETADKFISDIEAIPDELDFGSLATSQPAVRAVVLRNITSAPIDVNTVYIEAPEKAGYSQTSDCESLVPGQACMVTVTWSPLLQGTTSGVLVVEHTGPTRISSINLQGDYAPDVTEEAEIFPLAVPGKGLLVSSQSEVDFGSGIETTSTITVSLVNVGDTDVTLTDVSLAGSDNGLSLSKKGCGPETVLAPVEACPLTLSWSPVREGSVLDDIQVVHDGARGVLVLPVRGTSSGVTSKDNKAVRLAGPATATLAPGDSSPRDTFIVRDDDVDPASVLDGFTVTSHSAKRAIIAGPGGSRIVFDGEEVVLGGFLWYVNIRPSGVEFRSGDEKVLLLFDRSLSSFTASGDGSSSSSSSSTDTGG